MCACTHTQFNSLCSGLEKELPDRGLSEGNERLVEEEVYPLGDFLYWEDLCQKDLVHRPHEWATNRTQIGQYH